MISKFSKYKFFVLALVALLCIPISLTVAKYAEIKDVGTVTLNIQADAPVLHENWKSKISNVTATSNINVVLDSYDNQAVNLGTNSQGNPVTWDSSITYVGGGNSGTPTGTNFNDDIRLFFNNTSNTLYVLAKGNNPVTFPKDSNNLFTNLDSVQSFNFAAVDTSEVTDMSGIFSNLDNSNLTTLDLTGFDTSNVTNMHGMFKDSDVALATITLKPEKFSTSNVTDMGEMFSGCKALTALDLTGFDTTNVSNMNSMFYNCEKLATLAMNTDKFNTSNVADMDSMFNGCSVLTELDVSKFNTSKVTNMGSMFKGCSKLTALDVSKFDTSQVTNMGSMFRDCRALTTLDVSGFNTAQVKNMWYMFYNCSKLSTLDVSKFNTANVTDMQYMFYNCSKLSTLDVSGFGTSNVTNMKNMFYGCSGLTALDVSKFDTGNVTNMSSMFRSCSKLTELDVSKFVTTNVTSMESMFNTCSKLTTLDLSSFDTQKVTTMSYMFYDCSGLTGLNVSGFNTQNVTNMSYMFGYLSNSGFTSLDLSSFNTANVTTMQDMFAGCYCLKAITFGDTFVTSKVTNMKNMFNCYRLQRVTLGPDFKFVGTNGYLPTPSAQYITGADGNWYTDQSTGYTPAEVATHQESVTVATTYYAVASEAPSLTATVLSKNWGSSVTFPNGNLDLYLDSFNAQSAAGLSWENGISVGQEDETGGFTDGVKLFVSGTNIYILAEGDNPVIFPEDSSSLFSCLGNGDPVEPLPEQIEDTPRAPSSPDTMHIVRHIYFGNIDTGSVTNMSSMFYMLRGLGSLDLTKFDTSNVTDMSSMFYDCYNMKSLNISSFNTKNVTSMNQMFNQCTALKVVTLGSNFQFFGTDGYLPVQSSFTGADGKWYTDQSTGYTPAEVAAYQATVTEATTYYAVASEVP